VLLYITWLAAGCILSAWVRRCLQGKAILPALCLKPGLGIEGLVIIIFSTVTTTFLDAFSAGVSTVSIAKNVNEKRAAVIVCFIGTALAIFIPTTQFENFLYLISSVFAPMIAIQVVDYFILKSRHVIKLLILLNLVVWIIGFAIYRYFMELQTPIGNTVPVMLITGILCIIGNKLFSQKTKEC
jgi:purine-cytosine permease-like protein